ncbi:MAG: DUF3575 domain-containing protein [Bacteroidales bacterium]|nr:DUF3575 domain-containing protein [Bacteroidales bacterium]
MKKIIASLILAVASLGAYAQDAFIGGSFGVNRDITDNQTEFTIAPEIGYKFDSKWSAAVALAYNYNYNDGRKTNVFKINPYARYTYFATENNLVNLFVDGGFGIGFGKTKYEDYDGETVTVWSIGFKPGVALNLTNKFSIVAHMGFLGYEGSNNAGEAAGYDKKFGLNFSTMNLNLGFYYNF